MGNTIESALISHLTPSPMDAPAVKWGIIGAGWISGEFAKCVTNFTSSVIAAVGSRDEEKARAFIAENIGTDADTTIYTSYEDLVRDPDIDVVYIGTPHSHHRDHALLAINAGKHVLVEKAFTRNAAEAREVLDAARAQGVFVMEAMWTRHLPHIAAVRDIVANGTIGEVTTILADHGQYFPFNPQHRLFAPELAGGALLDLGVYPVAFAHDLLGTPDKIVASGALTQTGVDGQIAIIFEYADGVRASLHTTLWGQTPTTASIVGSKGRIDIEGAFYAPSAFTVVGYDGSTSRYERDEIRGLEFEAAEVARSITAGKTESERMTWQNTLDLIESMDEIRAQVGVRYPGECWAYLWGGRGPAGARRPTAPAAWYRAALRCRFHCRRAVGSVSRFRP
jgi:predicted dehydrogenase